MSSTHNIKIENELHFNSPIFICTHIDTVCIHKCVPPPEFVSASPNRQMCEDSSTNEHVFVAVFVQNKTYEQCFISFFKLTL